MKIPLHYKSNKKYFALVDEGDFDFLMQFAPWKLNVSVSTHTFYSYTIIDGKSVSLHRLLLGVTDSKIKVDHEDGNGLNNRRNNIRVITDRGNGLNRNHKARYSKNVALGIKYCTFYNKYKAQISYRGKMITIGYFDHLDEAIKARKEKQKQLIKLEYKEDLSLDDILEASVSGKKYTMKEACKIKGPTNLQKMIKIDCFGESIEMEDLD